MPDNPASIPSATVAAVVADAYKDLLQPSARRFGEAVDVIAKIALSPVGLVNWSYEASKEWLQKKLRDRVSEIPPEERIVPPGNILLPAISRIALSHDTQELRELYAELLLKAMDKRTSALVHPAYIYLVEQITAQEAFILLQLYKCTGPQLFLEKPNRLAGSPTQSVESQFEGFCRRIGLLDTKMSSLWLENLCRLRLIEIRHYMDPEIRSLIRSRYGSQPMIETNEARVLEFTELGASFVKACSPDGEQADAGNIDASPSP